MPGDVLLVMAASGDQEAREERLIREIMAVDRVNWPEARQTFLGILAANRKGLLYATLPYKIGICVSFTAGVLSFPLIFHLDTVLVFNELYVTTDVPEARDLETPLEVGAWSFKWMQAPLGQISFFLLCMQVRVCACALWPLAFLVPSPSMPRVLALFFPVCPRAVGKLGRQGRLFSPPLTPHGATADPLTPFLFLAVPSFPSRTRNGTRHGELRACVRSFPRTALASSSPSR
jgi:hypothetical protein